jgi:DNA-binding NarL/FixJ family response regulator
MTALTFAPPDRDARLLLRDSFAVCPPAVERRRLLLFSDDENFWQSLLTAASEAGPELVRKRAAADVSRTLRLLRPAVVLLDLDSPAQVAWDAADSMLQEAKSPPLLLLTSHSGHVDFETAIQAGSLIDKSECPTKLLEAASLTLKSSAAAHRERSVMQKVVIRWLRPCNLSAEAIPLRRFWGINE